MNAKEAREIVAEPWIGGYDEDYARLCRAKGFLDCHEQMSKQQTALKDSVKPLVEALDYPHPKGTPAEKARLKALSQFRKAQGEE